MANTGSHPVSGDPEMDPLKKSRPGGFMVNVAKDGEWVARQEEALGVKLTTATRMAIAIVMNREGSTPLTALEEVKRESFEGAEGESDIEIIDAIIARLRKQIGETDVTNLHETESLE